MQTKLVVFDIAGTTVADFGNVNEAFRAAFFSAGIEIDHAYVNELMGYRKIDAIRVILEKHAPHLNGNAWVLINQIHEQFTRNMVAFYESNRQIKSLPFAEETFGWCKSKGIKVALNTGFTRVITDRVLERLGWQGNPIIDTVISSDEVPEGRPHPYMIGEIMRRLDIKNVIQVAKVGDTEVDVKEGRNAGCGLVVSITTGAYTRQQLEQYQPDQVIDSLEQLPALIF